MLPNCSCRTPAFITVCKTASDSHGLKLNYPPSKISLCSSTSVLSRCLAPKLATSLNISLIFNASLPSPSLHLKKCCVLQKDFQEEGENLTAVIPPHIQAPIQKLEVSKISQVAFSSHMFLNVPSPEVPLRRCHIPAASTPLPNPAALAPRFNQREARESTERGGQRAPRAGPTAQWGTMPKSVFRSDPGPFSFQLMPSQSTRIPPRCSGNANWQKESSSRLITARGGQVNESQQRKSQQTTVVLSPCENMVFPLGKMKTVSLPLTLIKITSETKAPAYRNVTKFQICGFFLESQSNMLNNL